MTKDKKEWFEFFKPREFVEAHPGRARVLEDDVLSKYVSWALVEKSAGRAGQTYLLMSASAYRKACNHFEPMTDEFATNARHKIEAPLREQYDVVTTHEATISSLQEELREIRDHRATFEENQKLIVEELKAVRILKRELQSLIEHLKIGDSDTPTALRGFFARIDEFAFNVFAKEARKVTHRRAKAPSSAAR